MPKLSDQQASIAELKARIDTSTSVCNELTEDIMWSNHGTVVWEASAFRGPLPHFYPVYRHCNAYSYSPLALILRKGYLAVDSTALTQLHHTRFRFLSGSATIDREIERVGGPHASNPTISDVDVYARSLARALQVDVSTIEAKHPGKTNIVLCGGKDSLNLLLLRWENPLIVFSAEPNFYHVDKFVRENGLHFEVRRLEDPPVKAVLQREVLENCCRGDLMHYRWGAHLQEIARQHDRQVIFWKGQVADAYTTPKWKTIMYPDKFAPRILRKVYKRMHPLLPGEIDYAIGTRLQRAFVRVTWARCAMFQGSHMSLLRELTDSLVLSAYHGPEVTRVLSQVDLAAVVHLDMRHLIALELFGRMPIYPTVNPAPPPSSFRAGMHNPERLFSLLENGGLPVERCKL
jgi:hypothetical protein